MDISENHEIFNFLNGTDQKNLCKIDMTKARKEEKIISSVYDLR
jgi:hypothetical protein